MKKAVIYARYSSDSQTEQSIDGQLRVCREFAEKENIKIVDTYIDRAMTGTNDHRPDFQRMLRDSKKKGFDFVLVYKFDRFARSRHDSAVNKAILSRNGVKVISATEQISDTPEGIILEGMLESFAEYYSAELSQKVRRGRKESRIKGLFVGGRKPFGYCVEDKVVKINEKQAEIVRQVYNDYISGMRLKDIAGKLNKQGIKTNNGKDFNINQVSRMLRSPFYCGKVYADDTVYTNIYPPIIDEELFDKVNKSLQTGKKTAAQKKAPIPFILSGKLVCGKCKANMTGDSGTGRNGVHYYYKCVNRKRKHSCDKKSVEKDYIENYVVSVTKEFLKNNKQLKELSQMVADVFNDYIGKDVVLNSLNAQMSEIDRKLNNMANAIANGIFSKTTNQKLNELEQEKENLEIKIAQQQAKSITPLDADKVYKWFLSFQNIDISDKLACKRMIDMFVNKIVLYDGYFDIYFNSSDDESKNIKLENVEDYTEIEKEQSGSDCSRLVLVVGLEPTRCCQHRILSPTRLPFHHTSIRLYVVVARLILAHFATHLKKFLMYFCYTLTVVSPISYYILGTLNLVYQK